MFLVSMFNYAGNRMLRAQQYIHPLRLAQQEKAARMNKRRIEGMIHVIVIADRTAAIHFAELKCFDVQ